MENILTVGEVRRGSAQCAVQANVVGCPGTISDGPSQHPFEARLPHEDHSVVANPCGLPEPDTWQQPSAQVKHKQTRSAHDVRIMLFTNNAHGAHASERLAAGP